MKPHFLLLLTLLTGGCAHLPNTDPITLAHINAWLAADEYGNALAALQRQTQQRPGNDSLRSMLQTAQKSASRYAEEKIAAANQLAKQNHWDKALQEIDDAREHWPQSAVLRVARDELETRRQQRIEQLQLELLLHEGRSLLETARQHRELELVNPGYLFLDWDLRKYQAKRRAVARKLLEVGLQVQEEGDLRLAQHCFVMAQRLEDSPEIKAALRSLPRIERVEESEKYQPQRHQPIVRYASRKVKRQQHVGRLLAEYARVRDRNDLAAARRIMLQMLEINPNHPRVRELKAEQDVLIQQSVQRSIARGDDLYSQERIKEAVDVWQAALQLDPFNKELRNKLDRAKTALKTLQEIKQNPR